jgi:hypothetical protein
LDEPEEEPGHVGLTFDSEEPGHSSGMAKTVALVHPHETVQVLEKLLVLKCDLFRDDPAFITFPYNVKSQVSLPDFRDFISALEDKPVTINNDNFRGLSQLGNEFHFRDLTAQLS